MRPVRLLFIALAVGSVAPRFAAPGSPVEFPGKKGEDRETKSKEAKGQREVIVVAKRPQAERERTAGSVTVIAGEALDTPGASIADVLEKETSVRVRRYGGRGSYSTLSLRGSNPNQVNVSIDGIPLNNAVSGEVNLSDLSAGGIGRIELYRTGRSGDSSIGGSVNLVTEDPGEGKEAVKARVLGGSFGTAGAFLKAYGPEEKSGWRYLAVGGYEVSRQDYIFRNDNGTPVLNTNDDFDDERQNAWYRDASGTLSMKLKTGLTQWSFLNDTVSRRHGVPGPGSAQTEKTERNFLRNTTGVGSDSKGLFADWFRLQSRVFYTDYLAHFYDPEQEFASGRTNSYGRLQHFGAHLEPQVELPDYHQSIRLLLKQEREIYHRDELNRFDEHVRRVPTKFRIRNSAYLEDKMEFDRERWLIELSAGYERYSDRFNDEENQRRSSDLQTKSRSLSEFSAYRGGIRRRFRPFPAWQLDLKAAGTTGQRMPLFLELFGEQGAIVGNSELRPERSETVEGGFVLSRIRGNWKGSLDVTVFRRRMEDMILFVPNSRFSLRAENVDAAEIKGVEISGRVTLWKTWKYYGSYTGQDARNRSSVSYLENRYLPLRPRHELGNGLGYEGEYLRAGVDLVYVGAVYKDRSNEAFNYEGPRQTVGAFLKWSWYGREEARELLFAIEVKNILNERVSDIVGYPLPGRSVYASAAYRF